MHGLNVHDAVVPSSVRANPIGFLIRRFWGLGDSSGFSWLIKFFDVDIPVAANAHHFGDFGVGTRTF